MSQIQRFLVGSGLQPGLPRLFPDWHELFSNNIDFRELGMRLFLFRVLLRLLPRLGGLPVPAILPWNTQPHIHVSHLTAGSP